MLSAGNLNTAALSLFLALHLAVEPRLPCLLLDDPVQAMDEVHIAQFAAVLEPVPTSETPRVSQVSAALDAATKTVKIAYGDREDVLTFSADGTLSFTVDGEQVLSDEDREK